MKTMKTDSVAADIYTAKGEKMTSVYSTAEVHVPENPPKPKGYHLLIVMPKVQ